MHPHLLRELAAIHQAELLDEAEKERLARTARSVRAPSTTPSPVAVRRIAAVAVLLILMLAVGGGLAGTPGDDGVASTALAAVRVLAG